MGRKFIGASNTGNQMVSVHDFLTKIDSHQHASLLPSSIRQKTPAIPSPGHSGNQFKTVGEYHKFLD
jgi:hypothetical protein